VCVGGMCLHPAARHPWHLVLLIQLYRKLCLLRHSLVLGAGVWQLAAGAWLLAGWHLPAAASAPVLKLRTALLGLDLWVQSF
jgi:hypothetical protein